MADISGTSGDDTLIGTACDDEILGLNGDDSIDGAGGNDVIYGGRGDDDIAGGDGADRIRGGRGDDDIDGGNGADRIHGGRGDDDIDGGDGADRIHGGRGDDDIDGGDGADRIGGDSGNDLIDGGAGDDMVFGNGGDDTIHGGTGDDIIYGDNGLGSGGGSGQGGHGSGSGSGHGGHGSGSGSGQGGYGSGSGSGHGGHGSGSDGSGSASASGSGQVITFNDYLNGGVGDDQVFAEQGDDRVVHVAADNAGATDHYDGGLDFDTLELQLTGGELADAQVQADIAAFLDFLALNSDVTSDTNEGPVFAFTAFDLTARNFENLVITNTGGDQAPVATDDTATTDEGNPIVIDVLDNDFDPDGGIITITDVTSVPGGTVTIDGGGNLVFTPDSGFSGTTSFEYTITDDTGLTDTATVVVEVTPVADPPLLAVNNAPVANDDFLTLDPVGPTVITDTVILGNDSDPDIGGLLTDSIDVTAVAGGVNGTVSLDVNGDVVFTPDAGFTTGSFEYTISDDYGLTDTATVTVTDAANQLNHPPVATDDTLTIDPDTQTLIPDTVLLGNDYDPDVGDTIDVTGVSGGVNGTVSLDVNGDVVFTPDAGFTGTASFEYTITDASGVTDTAIVTVTVGGPPAATLGAAVGDEDTAIPLGIAAALTDTDGSESLSDVTISGVPTGASLSAGTDLGGGVWSLTQAQLVGLTVSPLANSDVDFTLQLSVTSTESANGATATTTASLDVIVNAVADAPTLTTQGAAGDEDTAIPLSISSALTDVDGSESLSAITISSVPTGAALSAGTDQGGGVWTLTQAELAGLTITPAESDADDFTLTVSVTSTEAENGDTATTTGTIDVVVNAVADPPLLAVNNAPVANDDFLTLDPVGPTVITDTVILGNDSDPDIGGLLTDSIDVTAVAGGVNGTVSLDVNGDVVFTPDAGFTTGSFEYTISDDYGLTDTATVTVTDAANQLNHPPVANDDTLTIDSDAPTLIPDTVLLGNDYDPDAGDTIDVTAVSGGVNGTVSLDVNGDVVFTPDTGFTGTASFEYTITDSSGVTDTAIVTVTVGGPAPATLGAAVGDEDTAIPLGIAAALADIDGSESLSSVTISGVPVGATLSAGTLVGIGGGGIYAGGTEFQVNTETASVQRFSSVAGLGDGGFIATWESLNQDGNGYGVFSQRFDAGGAMVSRDGTTSGTDEFQINTTTAGNQAGVSVSAALSGGGFVVVWNSFNQAGATSATDIFGQRFDSAGNAVGGEFQVNSFIAADQNMGKVVGLTGGGFVVVWESGPGQDVSGQGVFGQQYDAAGNPVGGEFLVNSSESFDQRAPSLAALNDGGYVVVWESDFTAPDSSSLGVFGQRYDAGGNAVGGQFLVNTFTASSQSAASVTGLDDGGYMVAWRSFGQDGDSWGIYGQRYDAAGATVGTEFQVNTETAGAQDIPEVVALDGGGYVVVWQSAAQDGSGNGVFGQAYDAANVSQGGEFQINSTTAGDQGMPVVTALTGGGFVATWDSADADQSGVFAKVFTFTPTGLATWEVAVGDLAGLTVTPPADSDEDFTLTLSVTSTEAENGDQATTTASLDVTVVAVADAPTLATSDAAGDPDTAIPLSIASALTDVDGSESLTLTITGVPGGASLSAGTDLGGGSWSLTTAQLTGLTITPPPGSEVDFTLGVTATSTEAANGDEASTTGTIIVTVTDQPADAPTLTTTAATGNEDTAIPLSIASALTDPGEVLSVEISGVPVGAGASLSAGTDQGGGVWLLTPAQLTGLTITPPTNSDVDFSLTVTATSTEPLNGSTATTTATLDVTVIAVADAPTLSAAAAGDEDTPIPLTISAALTDTDGSESLSAVRIFGVPTGATLSAGTFVPSMTGTSVSGGSEIQVNTFTANAQRFSSIAPLNDGGFISTWESVSQDTSGFGVYSQRWDAAGQAVGGEFRVNTTTFNNQGGPSVAAALGDGGWVAVWTSQGQDGSGTGIFGQRYDVNGNTAGGEFQVNDFTTNNQGAPDVQALVGGGFVVTWESEGQDVSGQGVFAKQYDTSGVEVVTPGSGVGPAIGNEFLVNSAESFAQRFGSVGALQDGGYVVVWESDTTAPDSSGFGVFGQRYDQTGNTIGGQFLANTTTFSSQNNGAVTGLGDGGFVIAWQSFSQDGDGWGVYAQRYDVNGTQVGGELQVNTTTASSQQRPAISALAGGGFVVVWEAFGQDGSGWGAFGQAYDASGAAIGGEFQVNDTIASDQTFVDVTGLIGGGFMVTWDSLDQDGSSTGVFGKQFSIDPGTDNSYWEVIPTELAGLTLTPPADSDANITLTLEVDSVEASNGDTATTTAALDVTINAVADAPVLNLVNATGDEDTAIPLSISQALNDTDGSEVLGDITISNVPLTASLSAGTNLGGGVWVLTSAQLAGLTISPLADSDVDFTLQVSVNSTELANGNSAITTGTIDVTVVAVADDPNVSTPGSVSGNQDTPVVLGIGSSLNDTDGSESLAITISGVPGNASLTAGTDLGGGIWALLPGDLAGLQLIPPPGSDTDITLTIAATSTESENGDQATVTASLDVILDDTAASTPTLTVTAASGDEDTAIPLSISGALGDTDGSETLTFQVSLVPTGASLSAGVDQGGGVWLLTAAQTSGLTIDPPANSDVDFTLGVSAISTESNGGATSVITGTIDVTVIAVADDPTLSTQDVFGIEDTIMPLTISSALTDLDSSESLSITIAGVPPLTSLSAGIDQGGGVWLLTPAQLAGLTISPAPSSDQGYILTVTATSTEAENGDQAFVTDTINVNIDAVADTPNLVLGNASGDEDTGIPLTISSSLVDTDGSESLSIMISGVPVGGGATLSAGVDQGGGVWLLTPAQLTGLTITPPTNSDVDFSLTVTATSTESANGDMASATGTIDVTVIAVADQPTLSASAAAGPPGNAIPLTISSALTDTDSSESLAITIAGVPPGGTLSAGIDQGGGVWLLTPAQLTGLTITPATGTTDFSLTVISTSTEAANGDQASISDTFAVTMTDNTAEPPTLTVQTASGNEDTPIPLTFSAALTDTDGSESLSFLVSGVPAGGLSAGIDQGGGTWLLTPAQTAGLTVTPPADSDVDFNLTVTARSTESNGGATADVTGTLAVTVIAVADAPTLTLQDAQGFEDQPVALSIGDALTDTDGSESLGLVTISGLPTDATLSAGTNLGGGVWTVSQGQLAGLSASFAANGSGVANLTVSVTSTEASNGDAATTTGTLTLTVVPVNDAPVAVDDGIYQGTQDIPIVVNATSGVLINDSDPLDSPPNNLAATLDTGPSFGSVALAADGSFTYTPDAGFHGNDSFTYVVSDDGGTANGGQDTGNTATVSIFVDGVNLPPDALDSTLFGLENSPISGILGATDPDHNFNDLTFTLEGGGPATGAVTVNPDGTFTYSPGTDFVGFDSFDFRATDPFGDFDVATITVDIAQVAPPPEFEATPTLASKTPQATALANGGFVITWASNDLDAGGPQPGDGSQDGVFFQQFDSVGNKVGGEIQANTFTTSSQLVPAIASLPDGGWLITWASSLQDGSSFGIYAQRFDANGAMVSRDGLTPGADELQINTVTDSNQFRPRIETFDDGSWVIVWHSSAASPGGDGSGFGAFARRYDSNGNALDVNEFQVNAYTVSSQLNPDVTVLTDGGFLVTYQSFFQDAVQHGASGSGGYGVYGQRYDAAGNSVLRDGVTLGVDDFLINTTVNDNQELSSVTALQDGGFAVAWQANGNQDGDGNGVFMKIFDANGVAETGEIQVNGVTALSQQQVSIAELGDGSMFVTWSSDGQDGDGFGVFGQRVLDDGTLAGNDFQINTAEANNQTFPDVMGLVGGGFVTTWQTQVGATGNNIETVAARLFGPNVSGMRDLTGGTGNDFVLGSADADDIDTQGGNDIIDGLAGDDKITGGGGADGMTGGLGADAFFWNAASEGQFFSLLDSVSDFSTVEGDVLDFSGFITLGGGDVNDFVQLADNGTDTTVSVDADGLANGANFTELVLLQNNTGLVVDDLLADGNLVVTI